MIKIGTDFSGIGSPEQAIKNLDIKHSVEFSCEIDKYARKSYKEIHNCKKMYNDITERDHTEIDKLDLYIAGFPCQAFSLAGKRKGFEDVRGTLFFNVADFIKTNQPESFVLENVKGLLSHDSGRTFQTITDLLSNGGGTVNGQMIMDFFDDGLGYHIYHKVLNSKELGVPQNRERIFIVGFKNFRDYRFPKSEPLVRKIKDIIEHQVDDKYFLSERGVQGIKNSPFNSKIAIVQDQNHYASTLMARDYKDPKCIEVGEKIRKLTPLEYWRLQGFPDEAFFKAQKVNSDTQLYKQAGNSITVDTIQKVIANMGV